MAAGGGSGILRQKDIAQRLEEMRREKNAFEEIKQKIGNLIVQMKNLGIEFPELDNRNSEVNGAVSPTHMGEAVKLGQALLEDLQKFVRSEFETRLEKLTNRCAELEQLGIPDTLGLGESLGTFKKLLLDGSFEEASKVSETLEASISDRESRISGLLKERIDGILGWTFPKGGMEDARNALAPCFEWIEKNEFKKASSWLEENYREKIPQVMAKLLALGGQLTQVISRAKQMDIDTTSMDDLPKDIPTTKFLGTDILGKKMEDALSKLGEEIRPHAAERMERLKATLEKLKEKGAEMNDAAIEISALEKDMKNLPSFDIMTRIDSAERMVEGPLLRFIFGEVGEIRPYLEEARSLGRPFDEIVEGMNETRSLLNKKEFIRALEVSSLTLEKARHKLEDVDLAKNEIEEFKALLFRLGVFGFDVSHMQTYATTSESAFSRGDMAAAKEALREGSKLLGRQSIEFFQGQIDTIRRGLALMDETHRKYPPEIAPKLEEASLLLSSTNIPGAMEVIADASSRLQATVKGHVSERLEALHADVDSLTDESTRKTVDGLLAQVKTDFEKPEDAVDAIKALAHVEREVAGTMAEEVGRGLADLEEGQRQLEKMGVPVTENAREMAEIREILDTGDFVRAFRAVQDLSNRINQAAMGRAEETLSGAKLALLEVTKTFSEPSEVKGLHNAARECFQSGRYLAAYENALKAKELAGSLQARAQKVMERIGQIVGQMTSLRKKGAAVEELRPITTKIAGVKEAYQKLSFDAAENQLRDIQVLIGNLTARTQRNNMLEELSGVLSGASDLGIYTKEWLERLEKLAVDMKGEELENARLNLAELTAEIVGRIRPILEESVRTVELEISAAREEGLDTKEAEGLLSDAKEKLKAPVPVGAAMAVREVRKQFSQNRVLQEAAQKAVAVAKEMVGQAEMMNLSVIPFQARIDEITKKIDATEYGRALEMAQELRARALNEVRGHLNQLVGNLQNVILRAKRDGALTMVAENYVVQARNLVTEGRTGEVLQLVTKAENELERVELQHSIAQNSLSNLEQKAAEAMRTGLVCPELVKGLSQAKGAFDDGDYAKVMDIVLQGNDTLSQTENLRHRATSAFQRMRSLYDVSLTVGLKLDGTQVQDIEAALAEGRYQEADSISNAAWNPTREAIDAEFSRRIENATRFLEAMRPEDPKHEILDQAMKDAHQAKTKEDYPSLVSATDEAARIATEVTLSALKDQEGRLSMMGRAAELEEAREAQGLMDTISDNLGQGELGRVAERLTELRVKVDEALTHWVNREVDNIAEGALIIERFGSDGGPVIERIAEVRSAMQDKDLPTAAGRLVEADKAMGELLKSNLEERVRTLRQNIHRVREGQNVSTTGLEEMLSDVEASSGQGNHLAAARKLIDLDRELTLRKARQKEFVNLQYIVDSLMDQASSSKLDTSHAADLVEEAITFKTRGEYERALQAVQAAQKELKSLLNPQG